VKGASRSKGTGWPWPRGLTQGEKSFLEEERGLGLAPNMGGFPLGDLGGEAEGCSVYPELWQRINLEWRNMKEVTEGGGWSCFRVGQ
jgi:hypothetical protein